MMPIFLFSILLSFLSFADSQIALCEKEAQKFGDGNGQDKIPSDCMVHVEKIANKKQKAKSKDAQLSFIAFRNMIFITDDKSQTKGQNVIAGKYTELENIKEIILDEKNGEVVVLEESGDILFFSIVITGNVAPKRILRHESLESVSTIRIYQDEILALDPVNRELLIFSRNGNIHALEGKRNLSPLFRFQNINGEDIELSLSGYELSVISNSANIILDLQNKSIRKLTPVNQR
jgi:hypothetical protein